MTIYSFRFDPLYHRGDVIGSDDGHKDGDICLGLSNGYVRYIGAHDTCYLTADHAQTWDEVQGQDIISYCHDHGWNDNHYVPIGISTGNYVEPDNPLDLDYDPYGAGLVCGGMRFDLDTMTAHIGDGDNSITIHGADKDHSHPWIKLYYEVDDAHILLNDELCDLYVHVNSTEDKADIIDAMREASYEDRRAFVQGYMDVAGAITLHSARCSHIIGVHAESTDVLSAMSLLLESVDVPTVYHTTNSDGKPWLHCAVDHSEKKGLFRRPDCHEIIDEPVSELAYEKRQYYHIIRHISVVGEGELAM